MSDLRVEKLIERSTTHGHAPRGNPSPEHNSWHAMMQRCTNPKSGKYPRYGGRGIMVCERWRKFENFLEDMGPRPNGATLERKDRNGHYDKNNVIWAGRVEQANNRSNNRFIEYDGRSQTLAKWAEEIGVSYGALQSRLDRGWSLEEAMDPEGGRKRRGKR